MGNITKFYLSGYSIVGMCTIFGVVLRLGFLSGSRGDREVVKIREDPVGQLRVHSGELRHR